MPARHYPGSIIRATPVIPTTRGASGLWGLEEAEQAIAQGIWPTQSNDAFTKILLPFEGSNGSTVITDTNYGGSAHTWTANGNAALTTTPTPSFGTTWLGCDGTGDYVTTTDSSDFTLGSEDWTVDALVTRQGGNGTTRYLCGQTDSGGSNSSINILLNLTTSNVFACTIFVGAVTTYTVTGTTAITTTAERHIEVTRSGNTLRLFVDGTQEGGDVAVAGSINDSSKAFSVGRAGELTSSTWFGTIKRFRLSVGIARHTASFTPPVGPY